MRAAVISNMIMAATEFGTLINLGGNYSSSIGDNNTSSYSQVIEREPNEAEFSAASEAGGKTDFSELLDQIGEIMKKTDDYSGNAKDLADAASNVSNQSGQNIAESDRGKSDAGATPTPDEFKELDAFLDSLKEGMVQRLIDSGKDEDDARAIVDEAAHAMRDIMSGSDISVDSDSEASDPAKEKFVDEAKALDLPDSFGALINFGATGDEDDSELIFRFDSEVPVTEDQIRQLFSMRGCSDEEINEFLTSMDKNGQIFAVPVYAGDLFAVVYDSKNEVASGRYGTDLPTAYGHTSSERRNILAMPPGNDAEKMKPVESTRLQIFIRSTVGAQPGWAISIGDGIPRDGGGIQYITDGGFKNGSIKDADVDIIVEYVDSDEDSSDGAETNDAAEADDTDEEVNDGAETDDTDEEVNDGAETDDTDEETNDSAEADDTDEEINDGTGADDIAEEIDDGTEADDSTEENTSDLEADVGTDETDEEEDDDFKDT